MADISIDYEAATGVASLLNGAVTNIIPQLEGLRNDVTGLLTSDGGLWLQQSSPILRDSYQTFTTSVTEAVQSISSFAEQFNGIVTSLQQMDAQLTGGS